MTSLDWSVSAQNVLHKFYNANVTIYVEGKDDVNFWHHKFQKIASELRVHIEAVSGENVTSGGQDLLKKKMNSIIKDQGKFIVATDLDYDDFTKKLPVHPLIIKTYGYAIENSMYCPNIINYAICKKLHNFDFDEIKIIRETLDKDCRALYPILVLDIANIYYSKGLKILSGKAHKYLTDNGTGTKIKDEVVIRKISELKTFFQNEELCNIENMLKHYNKEIRYIIRGHFITKIAYNIYYNYLKKNGYTNKISEEMFYDALVDACQQQCCCHEIQYLKNEIKVAMAYLHKSFV